MALRAGVDCSRWPRHHQFIWRGQRLYGKRVFIRCYHGLGDTIQFVRFVPPVRRIARDVTLWAQPALIPLLRTMKNGPHRILPLHEGTPDADFDVDLELMELMHALRATLEYPRTPSPYLLAHERRHGRTPGPLRAGIVWKAGEWSRRRSIPCELLAPLGEVPGVEWLVFQRGEAVSEWRHSFGEVPQVGGVLDEARQMRELDVLVSVDTCSAHLAGALGIPVWTLLPAEADWRWMRDRPDSPWYPSMRLFRQRSSGDWAGVIDSVIQSLHGLRGSHPASVQASRPVSLVARRGACHGA